MRKFILKTVLFALLFVVPTAVIAFVNKRYFFPNDYLNEFPIKKELVRNTPSPKMVVLGGSNVAFGIDSKMLADSLGIPVVNAGLHAALGLRFIMDTAIPLLHKGDVLVIMPEYDHFFGTTAWGSDIALSFAPFFASATDLKSLNMQQLSAVARGLYCRNIKYFINGITNRISSKKGSSTYSYIKSGFDERGDEVSHRFKKSVVDMATYRSNPITGNINEEYLGEFISEVKGLQQSGIRVILLPPAILNRSLAADSAKIQALSHRLSQSGVSFQAPLDKFTYPSQYLYDTHYHLNAEGVRLNTRNVLSTTSTAAFK